MKNLIFVFSLFFFCNSSPYLAAAYEKVEDKSGIHVESPWATDVQWEKLRLENGLEVYLRSDPNATNSAAALTLPVGRRHEPLEKNGLAHLLEHTIMLGTKTHPEPSGFTEFLESRHGTYNACTNNDSTHFFFDVKNDSFKEAISYFSEFFKEPIFDEKNFEKEKGAVDQEYKGHLSHDGWRIRAVMDALFKEGTVFHDVRIGNSDTLKDVTLDDVKEWHNENYSSDIMKLAVCSHLPMEELIKMVDQHFSSIENKGRKGCFELDEGPTFDDNNVSKMICFEPLKEMRQLVIKWELPKGINKEKCDEDKLEAIVNKVLTNSVEGGLAYELQSKGFINSIDTKLLFPIRKKGFFSLGLTLTPLGAKNKEDVIGTVYSYIRSIQGQELPKPFFEVLKEADEAKIKNARKLRSINVVRQDSSLMLFENLETLPFKSVGKYEYNPNLLSDFFSLLDPKKAVYVLLDKEAPEFSLGSKQETNNITYVVNPIEESVFKSWEERSLISTGNLFPPENRYATNSYEIIKTPSFEEPQMIADTDQLRVCYYPVSEFGPKCFLSAVLTSPLFSQTSEGSAFAKLYLVSLYKDPELMGIIQQAKNAGFICSFAMNIENTGGLEVIVSGFNQHALKLLEDMVKAVKNHQPNQDSFVSIQDQVKRSLDSEKEVPPYQQVFFELFKALNQFSLETEEVLTKAKISFDDFNNKCKNLYNEMSISSFIAGNVSNEECLTTLNSLVKDHEPFSWDKLPKKFYLSCTNPLFSTIQPLTEMEQKAVGWTFENPESSSAEEYFKNVAANTVLDKILKSQFSTFWRSEQDNVKVYQSFANSFDFYGRQYTNLCAASTSFDLPEFCEKFSEFKNNVLTSIGEKNFADLFSEVKTNEEQELAKPYRNLIEQASVLGSLYSLFGRDFQRKEKTRQALNALTLEEFQSYCQTVLTPDYPRQLFTLCDNKKEQGSESGPNFLQFEEVESWKTYKLENPESYTDTQRELSTGNSVRKLHY